MKQKNYNGRVSSKENGVVFSHGQTFKGLSVLPTDETKTYPALYLPVEDPHSFIEVYPSMVLQLELDGTITSLETDVAFVDREGNHFTIEEAKDSLEKEAKDSFEGGESEEIE